MTKQEAIELFGSHLYDLAGAVRLTDSAVSQWPDDLNTRQIAVVLGYAAMRNVYVPPDIRFKCRDKLANTLE